MDIVLTGSVPMAVGLSSSSAIVVATAEAVCFLNNLTIDKQSFVELCGEGEWFVGSRGGAADHAAMKCSTSGHLTHLSFKPFVIGDAVPFSPDYAILVANSMQKAKKSEGAKDQFNAKVAASDVALMLLKKQYPQYNFKEFRDITAVPTQKDMYNMILSLPCKMTRHEILKALPKHTSDLERIFSNHADPGFYDVRGVALYGVCECIRAEKCVDVLNDGNYALLGQMMQISHRGDSVTDTMAIDDEAIIQLRDSETPLHLVSGAYECSTERIDGMCKLLNSYDGVLGSSLIGAGLGGCVLALVEASKANQVRDQLNHDFYEANGLEPSANIFLASPGSSTIC
jgi:N-acetylgalactosamine kinase